MIWINEVGRVRAVQVTKARCALHRAGDVGSCGVDNVEGFTVFVRNSLLVNKQAVAAVGKVIRMGIAGIFHGTTSWGF